MAPAGGAQELRGRQGPGRERAKRAKGRHLSPRLAETAGVARLCGRRRAQAALASPEGQAAAGDVANFATGGATLMIAEA